MKAANQLHILARKDQNPYAKKIYNERAKEYSTLAKEIKEKLKKGEDREKINNSEFYESQRKYDYYDFQINQLR